VAAVTPTAELRFGNACGIGGHSVVEVTPALVVCPWGVPTDDLAVGAYIGVAVTTVWISANIPASAR
jgi:hypothetical protein